MELRLYRAEAQGREKGAAGPEAWGPGVVADLGALVGLHVPAHHLALGVKGYVHEVGDGQLFRPAVPVDVQVLEGGFQGQGGHQEQEKGEEPPHRAPSFPRLGGKTRGTGSSPPG